MKNGFLIIAASLFFASIAVVHAQSTSSFLCTSSKIVAFANSNETGEWEPTLLPGDHFRFVVRPPRTGDITSEGTPFLVRRAYAVFEVGSNIATTECTEGVSEHGWLSCGLEYSSPFKMNTNTMRFILSNHGSYLYSRTVVLNDDGALAQDEDGNFLTRAMDDSELAPVLSVIGVCDEI